MEEALLILRDICFAAVVANGFAILFTTPKNVLWVAGLLGGIGHGTKFLLMHIFNSDVILSSLAGCVLIGLAGIYLAHKVHTPPDVFTIPACITMIPGMYAYRTMLGFIKISDGKTLQQNPEIIADTAHNFVLTSSLLFTLAIGICVGALLFRQKSAKHISYKHWKMKKDIQKLKSTKKQNNIL